jgi:hypothetical protein
MGLIVGGWREFGVIMPPSEVAQRLIGKADASGLSGVSSSTNEPRVSMESRPTMNPMPAGGVHQLIPNEVLVLNMLSSWDWNENTKDIVSLTNDYGHTLAHVCAASNFEELLSYLICCGIDLTKTDNQGRTAADFASFFGHSSILRLLQNAPHSSPAQSRCASYHLLRNICDSPSSQNRYHSKFPRH